MPVNAFLVVAGGWIYRTKKWVWTETMKQTSKQTTLGQHFLLKECSGSQKILEEISYEYT